MYLILHFNQSIFIEALKGFKCIGYFIADDILIVTSCKTFFCISARSALDAAARCEYSCACVTAVTCFH